MESNSALERLIQLAFDPDPAGSWAGLLQDARPCGREPSCLSEVILDQSIDS